MSPDRDMLTPREAPVRGVGKREAAWIVGGLTLAAAVLRLVGLGHQSYWYDEAFTVVLLHHSLPHMLSLVPQTEGTPPLYYCLAWLWTRVFGYTETGVRCQRWRRWRPSRRYTAWAPNWFRGAPA